MDPVRKEEMKMYGIATNESGFYYESLVINRTANPIMLIDHNNNKVTISPCDGKLDGTVLVIVRYVNGARRQWSKEKRSVEDIPIEGKKIIIDGWQIESGSIYIKEIDVILTNPDVGLTMRHHNSKSDLHEDIVVAIQGIATSKDGVSIHFVLNDPKGRVDHLFGAFGPSKTFKIDVISVPDVQHNATLSVVVGSKSGAHIQSIVDVESIFETGNLNIDQSVPLSLGLTADDAMRAASLRLKALDRQIMDQVAKRMSAEREDNVNTMDRLKSNHKIELSELKNKHITDVAERNKVISDLELEVKTGAEWKAMYLAQHSITKQDTDVHLHRHKMYEAAERKEKAKLATNSEAIKLFHTVAKVAGGIVVGAIVPYIAAKLKEK